MKTKLPKNNNKSAFQIKLKRKKQQIVEYILCGYVTANHTIVAEIK